MLIDIRPKDKVVSEDSHRPGKTHMKKSQTISKRKRWYEIHTNLEDVCTIKRAVHSQAETNIPKYLLQKKKWIDPVM